MKRVVITHAYSRNNSGDGLLVDEAVSLARAAFSDADLTVVALDPESFGSDLRTANPFTGFARNAPRMLDHAKVAVTGRPHPDVVASIADADLVLAVGGGYLRGATRLELLKTAVAHFPQLPLPKLAGSVPIVYLPQSIGPFPSRATGRALRRLRYADAVFVRDDRSHAFLRSMGIASERKPDLAVLAMGEKAPVGRTTPSARPALVARDLANAPRYLSNLRQLLADDDFEILLQSSGRGNDDVSFYQKNNLGDPSRSVLAATSSDVPPSVVVSVRLHGALQSIMAGVPSVHLSYERKGWGAYDDLGIARYVHSARDFDPDRVIEQVRELRSDPSAFWHSVDERLAGLRAERERLAARLRSVAEASA